MTSPSLMTRRDIYKAELIEICERQFIDVPDDMLKEDIKVLLCSEGVCECDDMCQRPFGSSGSYAALEFDHKIENSLLFECDEVQWRALRADCHQAKTSRRATALAKTRRVARKHGVDRESNPMPPKRGNRVIQGRGFQQKPDGYQYQWPRRKFGG